MLWFCPYRFTYDAPAHRTRRQLSEAFDQQGIARSVSGDTLKITRPMGPFFRNSWNPVFVADLSRAGNSTRLSGYFRPHAAVLAFTVVFLGMQLWWLWTAYQQPELRPGYQPGWRAEEIRFNLQFIGMFFVITTIGWLAGIPNARRILAALRQSARPPA